MEYDWLATEIREWIGERTEPNKFSVTLTMDLYRSWQDWVGSKGGRENALSIRALSQALHDFGYHRVKRNGYKYFMGIAIQSRSDSVS
jgi:hypothetical protein